MRSVARFLGVGALLLLIGLWIVRCSEEAFSPLNMLESEESESDSDSDSGEVHGDWRRLVDAEDIIQRQGMGLCSLIDATNIATLRGANDLVGWRCAYDAKVGAKLPIEDDKVTVCGNYRYNCNSTTVTSTGCSGKNITTESWTGVNCSEGINRYTLKNLVTTIDLNNRQLTGTIPPELGYLTGLVELDLSQNSLTGSIHSDWMCDSVHYLTMLRLDDNSLSSSIPDCIGNLTRLTDLRLANNQFSSTVPYSMSNLTSLLELDLSNNQLTGSFPLSIFYLPALQSLKAQNNLLTVLPDMGNGDPTESEKGLGGYNIDHLTYIDFSNNQITSNILADGTWGVWMPQLITLYLYNNAMTGYINQTVRDFQKLEDFRAYSNSLTGSIPDTIGDLTRLRTLMLDSNSLSSSIPEHIGLATALQTLTLSTNSLTKTIPVNITYLTNLKILDLSNNQFTGSLHYDIFAGDYTWEVPVNTFPLKDLEELYLYDNSLTGTWPEFGYLTSLKKFDLSRNSFLQELPLDLLGQNCTMLEEFICVRCNLTGTIPDALTDAYGGTFGRLTRLQKLELSYNALTGTIPTSVTNQSLLNYLYLDRNNLTGTIPEELFYLERLSYVFLSHNQLTGTIPASPASPAYYVPWILPYGNVGTNRLITLDLTSNSLTGTVPETLYSKNTNLQIIKLGTNSLTGTISTSLWTLTRLNTVWYSDNSMTGAFPAGYGHDTTPYLSSVMVASNGLTGAIPPIVTLSSLTELDLSDNAFTGTVQSLLLTGADDEIGNSLTILRLAGLSSSSTGLPTNLQYHTTLLELDLSNNQYSGSLIDELKLLTRLTKLELHQNTLSSTVDSDFFDNMASLAYVDFSENSLSGAFPFSSLASGPGSTLEYLKLYSNSFSSTVLSTIGTDLTGLTDLYLGTNSFTGLIPTSLADLANLDVLDITNNQFTGNMHDHYVKLGDFPKLRVFNIGGQSFDADIEFAGEVRTWLNKLLANTYMREMDISDTRLSGRVPTDFMEAATQLRRLDMSSNALTGSIPADSRMTGLTGMRYLTFDRNSFGGRLDADLCAIPNIIQIKAFPGNLDIECYPQCLTALLDVTTNANGVGECAPTPTPTASPTYVPSSAPSGQPTLQPTSAPTFMYYDGKFVQTGEYHWPNVSLSRNDTLCLGELEVRSVYPGDTFEESLLSNRTEIWCIEQRNYEEWRYFGDDDLYKDLNVKNSAAAPYPASGTLYDASKLHSLVYRGKQYNSSINFVTQSWDSQNVPSTSAYSDGGCGDSCAFTSLEFGVGDNSSVYVWEDALLACPEMGTTGHSTRKILPIARDDGWPYGSSAMIQKIRLTDIQPSPGLDSSSATTSSVDQEIASLFRTGTTQLVGAYLMVKGAVIGGRDRLSIQNAKRSWHENSTTCADSGSGPYEYAYDYSADLDTFTPTSIENVTISHDTHSWATVDITDMTRNQLVWWYLNHPTEAFELNLLWTPLNYTLDRTYGYTHYYHQAAGDPVGDTDRSVNMTMGRTEWYTSESLDPPLLLLYFQ